MELTLILARFWGILLIVSSLLFLLNKKLLPEILKHKENEEYLFLSGFIALLLGAIQIAAYNYWEISSRGLLTLFGWLSLLKGVVRLGLPNYSKKAIDQVGTKKEIYLLLHLIFVILGLYFLWVGFS